ncbi:c-type cytochrome [Stutzerimonas stutzeri]|uniref:c-type cytochrome n=1 Tax=Stutzerimonas stutzeri TaxID=316 RepID=UPI002109DB04|nr:cytochrome c [Stutzerimonas stutzeri]MCQ4256797.1 cytochrome c [Stutzerimonas stutzeri]
MFKTLTTLLLAALVLMLIGAGVVYFGIVNVAADTPHSAPIRALLETARERSIAVRAKGIEVPDLSDPELIRSGAGNYDAMCAICHLAPGVESTELSKSLNPAPPDLTAEHRKRDAAHDFWIVKHGIKATGMPAWGQSMEDHYIWGLIALLEQLPALTAMDYQALVATSGGHQHGGGETHMATENPVRTDAQHHEGGRPAEEHHPAQPAPTNLHRHADGTNHPH